MVVHTSGSTGAPKAIRVEKRRMETSARITCDFLNLQPGNTALLCMPLDFIAGKMMVVRAIVRKLKLISVEPSGHPLHTIASQKPHIDFAAMVPLQVINSLQTVEERLMLESIGNLIIGGGAIDEQLGQQLSTFPNAVWSTYGMTETLSHIALRRLNGHEANEWYTPFEQVQVDTDARGCLIIDAPQVCSTPLVTNDRVELASNGRNFRILGRIDNVIDSGGIKIQIEEVEKKLKKHLNQPFVITKKHDYKLGEMVILLTESQHIDTIKAVCKQVLTNKYERPRLIAHIAHIPLTPTGKPVRKQAEIIASQL